MADGLAFDLARIGEVLERNAVRYVVIGGMSGAFHGMVDYRTKDVDLLVDQARENHARSSEPVDVRCGKPLL